MATLYNQSFEFNSDGVTSGNGRGTVTIQTAGPGGIPSSGSGNKFALLTEQDSDGDAGNNSGPFTNLGAYRSEFVDGATAQVKVYLDESWASGESFQYSVAANDTFGDHQRDFVFAIRAEGGGDFSIGGSSNAGFDGVPATLGTEISGGGWYTLQHVFNDVGGVLSVDLNLISSTGAVTHIATLSNPEDTIGTGGEVGGNRYGWFTDISVAGGIEVDQFNYTVPDPATPPSNVPTDGPDNLTGTTAADTVSAGAGDDRVYGDAGNDQILGGAGSDTVSGGQDNDTIYGGGALGDPNDAGDALYGDTGNDVIYGNGGDDSIFGGQGSDTAAGGQGTDVMYGGDGDASPADGPDLLAGGVGADTIYGNGGDDQLYGNQDADLIFGGMGNDYAHGGQGNDLLYGNQGNDTLNGGVGDDQLTGGAGADLFVFDTASGNDVIADYNSAAGDALDLHGQSYTSSEVNGSTVLTLSGGGTITLLGVTEMAFQDGLVA